MLPENKSISLSGNEAIEIVQELEVILVSLHKIGAAFATKPRSEYERATTRFIDEWDVTRRLARARSLLASKFDTSLGSDDMDDLERACANLPYWEPSESENDS